jgi:hypothetical protein
MYHILRSPTWLLVVCWQEGERVWRLSWPRHDLGWFDSPRVPLYVCILQTTLMEVLGTTCLHDRAVPSVLSLNVWNLPCHVLFQHLAYQPQSPKYGTRYVRYVDTIHLAHFGEVVLQPHINVCCNT